jgi:hypothetical protein
METAENPNFTNDELVLDLGALQAIREMGGEDGDFVLNKGSNIKRDSMGCILKPKESPCD